MGLAGDLVTCARLAGASPEVVCVAIQVGDVGSLPDELTHAVAAGLDDTVALVRDEDLRLAGVPTGAVAKRVSAPRSDCG